MSVARESPRRAPGRRPLPSPMWKVMIAAHDVPPRWHIPASTVTLGAATAHAACVQAIRWAHRDAGVPPLLSMIALSMDHIRVEPARSVTARPRAAANNPTTPRGAKHHESETIGHPRSSSREKVLFRPCFLQTDVEAV